MSLETIKEQTVLETVVANVRETGLWKPYGSTESQAGYYIMLGLTSIAEQLGELAKAIASKKSE